MLRKHLTLPALAAVLLLGGATVTSCNQAQKQEVSAESDEAYNDFKTFVANTEAKADNAANEAEADYDRETAQLKSDFDTKVATVDKYADRYDDARRQEIEQLRTRYTTAYDRRETTWKSRPGAVAAATTKVGRYYKPATTYNALSAGNLASTYVAFNQAVKANADNYDIDDWRNINADWNILNAQKDRLDNDLSKEDKRVIAEEKVKYGAFKSKDKTQIRAEQGANAVAGAAKDVGKGAAEVGKDVGKGAAKAGKKVGNAVKGVFDGKDKND